MFRGVVQRASYRGKKRSVWELTEGERQIFDVALSEGNPNRLSNYFLRSQRSGTYWRWTDPKILDQLVMEETRARAREWIDGYQALLDVWHQLKRPNYFMPDGGQWKVLTEAEWRGEAGLLRRTYRVIKEMQDPQHPVFHHWHGFMFLPWQLQMFRARANIKVVPGGYGSAKTWGAIGSMLIKAMTYHNYTGMILAPQSKQSNSIFSQMKSILAGTPYNERFVMASQNSPYPKIYIAHSGINETDDYERFSTITAYPLTNPDSFLTLTVDEALVDQAEQVNIEWAVRTLTSRFRGMDAGGRERIGQITFLANSAFNPALYDLFDEGQDPANEGKIWSYQPATFENHYLTPTDLLRYEQNFGGDPASREMYIKGGRPLGDGQHFPVSSLIKCRDVSLDFKMAEGKQNVLPDYIREEVPKAGVYRWELPYEEGDEYILAADPGWGNPPYRNSAVLAVFKVTGFPEVPATMVAFHWVFGNNSPLPWITAYHEYVQKYRCVGKNAFDSTGFQAGYERMTDLSSVMPMPVVMTESRKMALLNLTKRLFAEGRFKIPAEITQIWYQLSIYALPDKDLDQDIVAMLLVASAQLEQLFYIDRRPAEEVEDLYPNDDRYWREVRGEYFRADTRF